MELSAEARKAMDELGKRFVAAGFPNVWYWPIGAADVGDAADELLRAGLLAPIEPRRGLRLTDAGRTWILESGGLVAVVCPKCSTDEHVSVGQREARARCHVCGVRWTEDTTVVPFAPRYG